jgi:hypothetical protein
MKMNGFLAALGAMIQPAINYAEQKLASIGAALAAGIVVIFNGFTNDQRGIAANIIAFWQAKYHDAVAAGATPLTSAEQASTATLQEFCAEEGAEFQKEGMALITLLSSSVKQNLPTTS